MDAVTTLTPDADGELRDLRRRAYGPGSSGLSSAELSRLEALESRSRADTESPERPAEVSARQETTPRVSDGPEVVASATAASDPDEPAAPAPDVAGARTEWWRRRSLWIAAGAGVAVGVAVTLGVTSLGERAPDETRRQIETLPLPSIGYSGQFDEDSLRSYEQWNEVSLWTVERPDGATCLVVAGGREDDPAGWFGDMKCTLDGLDPQIDITVWQGMGEMLGSDLPADSAIRFVARHGVVDVWVDAAGGTSRS